MADTVDILFGTGQPLDIKAPTGLHAPAGTSQTDLDYMLAQLYAKRARNQVQTRYWEAKHWLKDFGISLPPEMRNINVVLGWPALAVTSLASRIMFDGIATQDDNDDLKVNDLLADAMIEATMPLAVTSALVHSCSFLIVQCGRPGTDDPDVVVTAKPATHATGLWDAVTSRLTDCLSIIDEDSRGYPAKIAWYSRHHVTTFTFMANGKWQPETAVNPTGRCQAVMLAYRPELTKPFGSPRISRPVMALTDAAMRTLARSEAHAEFFASPQRYALGVDEDRFKLDRWKAVMSHMLALGRDEDSNLPELGQFAQVSMTPHFDHLRAIAALMASEASLPLDALGIVHDNPSSAEAIYAAKESLVMEAISAERIWGTQIRQLVTTAVMLRDKQTEPPEALRRARVKWLNPATPSPVSAADAATKFLSAIPEAANSEVALEMYGLDDAKIMRLTADMRKARGQTALEQLLAIGPGQQDVVQEAA